MQMPRRQNVGITNNEEYRFNYNGMEVDNEVSGNGNSYTTEFRQYDPRLGRWKSLDPAMAMFADMSPYVAFDNNPIYYVDPTGLLSEERAQKRVDRINNRNEKYDTRRTATLIYGGEERGFGVFVETKYGIEGNISYAAYFGDGKEPIYEDGDGIGYALSEYSTSFDEDSEGRKVALKVHDERGGQVLRKFTWNFESDLVTLGFVYSEIQGQVTGTPPDIGIGKGLKWGIKAIKKLFTRAGAKAAAKKTMQYSDEAKAAFRQLGTHASFTSIKGGVATIKIGFTNSITKESLSLVESSLKSNGANSVKVLTGKVKDQYKSVFNECVKSNRTYKGYTVKKSSSLIHDFVLTKTL